jgi:hypothetical protein
MEEKTIKNRLAKLKTINKGRRKNKRFEYAACRSVISHHHAASILWGPNLFHNISNPNILDDALIRSTILILHFLLRRLRNCKHVAFEDDEGSSCPEGEAQAPLHQS